MLRGATIILGFAIAVYFIRRYWLGKNTAELLRSIIAVCIAFYLLRKYLTKGVCYSRKRLDGKTVIVTGGNAGIGKETAIDMAKRGAKVIIACRSMDKGNDAIKDIKSESGNQNIYLKQLDLGSLKSIRSFAEDIKSSEPRLDILINNAGVMASPKLKTEDGFEIQFGTNHLGTFLLTNLLLDLIKKSAPSRIVTVASSAHALAPGINFDDINLENYKNFLRDTFHIIYCNPGYCQSKLANILFTNELQRRLGTNSGVSCFSLHPGTIKTDLWRNSLDQGYSNFLSFPMKCFWKDIKQGAQTTIFCAVQEGLEKYAGRYFCDCEVDEPFRQALDVDAAKKLWTVSEKLVGLR